MGQFFNSKVLILFCLASISSAVGLKALFSANESFADTSEDLQEIPGEMVSFGESPENARNSFLIAADLIDRQQGKAALAKLVGLEQEYPLLAAHVLLAKGKAYRLEQNDREAIKTWQEVVDKYPESAATGEALYLLGESQSEYWQEAISKFPAHPRTHEIIRQQLKQNPNQPRLMAILVKYTPDAPGVDQNARSPVWRVCRSVNSRRVVSNRR